MNAIYLYLYILLKVVYSSSTLNSFHKIPSGLLCVYKPKGPTSNDVVVKVRNILQGGIRAHFGLSKRAKIKVGHGGTLDPLAEGIVVLGVGEGTKLMSTYLEGSKGYVGVGLLGYETDTLDSTGILTEEVDCSLVTIEKLESVLPRFRGNVLQKPPMYSALKRDGKKLYELARVGIEVEREARPVTVYKLELMPTSVLPHFSLDIECSGGFYVRSVISDIARACGSRAHMTALTRTKQGPFNLNHCIREENWSCTTLIKGIIESSTVAGINCDTLKPAYDSLSDGKLEPI